MAVLVANLVNPVQVTTSTATLYTVPSTPSSTVLGRARIRFTNTDTGSHSITAYAVPSGGSATVTTCFLNAEAIAANSHLDSDVPLLGPGGTIQAKADAADISAAPLDGILFS